MVVFPNCKINLGLHVLQRREDGYHALETVFYPLPLHDVLEVITGESTRITISGLPVAGTTEENLCIKAWHLLKKDFFQLPPVDVYLHKHIPVGAGLGGGSADGAFMLRLLNEKFQLELPADRLLEYAARLGSDCPFFILNKPCLATGRGESLEPISLDLSGYSFLLVHPGLHINTAWAFSQITPAIPAKPLIDILRLPVQEWRSQLTNDFEAPVCQHHPALKQIRDTLYSSGALYASMTGSGSCFYGIFPRGAVPPIAWSKEYSVFSL